MTKFNPQSNIFHSAFHIPHFLLLLALAWAATPGRASEVSSGPLGTNITTVQFKSNALESTRTFNILLPVDYDQTTRRYPALYLLHGLGDDHMAWGLMTNLSGYAAGWNTIVVMPDGGRSFYVNSATNPKDRYEDLIVKDLITYVDSHYRTIPLRRSRAVAGLSMGGYGAMFLGLKHPDKFAAIGSFSGALGFARRTPEKFNDNARLFGASGPAGDADRAQRDPFALIEKVPQDRLPAIYIACGGQDFLLSENRSFVDLLSKKKIPYEYHEVSPRVHSWDFWNDEICNFVDILAGLPGFEDLDRESPDSAQSDLPVTPIRRLAALISDRP